LSTPTQVWRPGKVESAGVTTGAREDRGGIAFDDDDLSDYMHPDDVPAAAKPGDGERDPRDET
jgi:hypothetical protein